MATIHVHMPDRPRITPAIAGVGGVTLQKIVLTLGVAGLLLVLATG